MIHLKQIIKHIANQLDSGHILGKSIKTIYPHRNLDTCKNFKLNGGIEDIKITYNHRYIICKGSLLAITLT